MAILKSQNKGGSGCQVTAHLTIFTLFALFLIILSFNTEIVENLGKQFRDFGYVAQKLPDWSQESHVDLKAFRVEALLDKLRGMTQLASDEADYSLTAKEREAWNAQYPCHSRSELPAVYNSRNYVTKLSSNQLWDQVLYEYSNLHRICMKRVGNVTDYFLNKSSNVSIPGCKFLVGEGTNGLGNKILVTASAVLYAIITQRVLLIPARTNMPSVLCEPFVGSSWLLDDNTFPMPGSGANNNSWEEGDAFMTSMKARMKLLKEEGETGNCNQAQCEPLPPLVDALIVSSGWYPTSNWQPKQWFYCSTEQNFVSAVPWVYFSGCIYAIPKIFGSPAFRSTLKALFPDNMVLTRVLRSTVLPSDSVWSRFKHLNRAYFQQADRRVAIQLRFFLDAHEKMSNVMNDRVLDCVLSNGILPDVRESDSMVATSSEVAKKSPSAAPVTMVLITSLYEELHDHLNKFYLTSPTVTGEDVGVVQLTSHMRQSTGLEEDIEALVEVLLLSVSDALLVTPVSTFGGIAQGYGGLTPWFIRSSSGDTNLPSCERAQTVDTCQQEAILDYECPNDPSRPAAGVWDQGQLVSEQNLPPAVGNCLAIDVKGVQVLNATTEQPVI